MNSDNIKFTINIADINKFRRLDHYLVAKLEGYSRSFIKTLFEKGLVNSLSEKNKLNLKKIPPVGTIIEVEIPPPVSMEAIAENLPLEIVFEDEHLLVVNKSAGIVTHPAPGNYTGTLVNAILYHIKDLKGIGDSLRPGIVHRLDKGTSGLMVVSKSMSCHEGLIQLFSTHTIDRVYEAIILKTNIPPAGTLKSNIGRHRHNRLKMAANVPSGKHSVTHYKTIKKIHELIHIRLKLETGRTHQIRVHLSSLINAPILMDPVYGNPKNQLKRLSQKRQEILKDYPHPLLHARILGFVHPITKEKKFFEIDPPEIFTSVLTTD